MLDVGSFGRTAAAACEQAHSLAAHAEEAASRLKAARERVEGACRGASGEVAALRACVAGWGAELSQGLAALADCLREAVAVSVADLGRLPDAANPAPAQEVWKWDTEANAREWMRTYHGEGKTFTLALGLPPIPPGDGAEAEFARQWARLQAQEELHPWCPACQMFCLAPYIKGHNGTPCCDAPCEWKPRPPKPQAQEEPRRIEVAAPCLPQVADSRADDGAAMAPCLAKAAGNKDYLTELAAMKEAHNAGQSYRMAPGYPYISAGAFALAEFGRMWNRLHAPASTAAPAGGEDARPVAEEWEEYTQQPPSADEAPEKADGMAATHKAKRARKAKGGA